MYMIFIVSSTDLSPSVVIYLSNGIGKAFGAPKGQETLITTDMQEGALMIRKA